MVLTAEFKLFLNKDEDEIIMLPCSKGKVVNAPKDLGKPLDFDEETGWLKRVVEEFRNQIEDFGFAKKDEQELEVFNAVKDITFNEVGDVAKDKSVIDYNVKFGQDMFLFSSDGTVGVTTTDTYKLMFDTLLVYRSFRAVGDRPITYYKGE